jgi:sialate O-acetylesterase
MHRNLLFVLALCAVTAAWGDVRLPRLVGDGMVLQRDAETMIWGWADPGEGVRVAFKGRTLNTDADRKGHWSMKLGSYPAGGPFDMSIVGHNSITLHDIWVGDVWLASGQSNMEMPMNAGEKWRGGVDGAVQELALAWYPEIRLFKVERNATPTPQADVGSKQGWQAVTPRSAAEFSAVAYFFGRALYKRYHVPIGLIDSTWGGTAAETWMSEAALGPFPEFAAPLRSLTQVTAQSRADYQRYVQEKSAWYQLHGGEDRGLADGRPVWADPHFDASGWPIIVVPRPFSACGKDFNGFRGVVWMRRTITVPPGQNYVAIHLGEWVAENDQTFFNGDKIGETNGVSKPRNYIVPADHVHEGLNTLVVRLQVNDPDIPCTGIFIPDAPSPDHQLRADIGRTTVSLQGPWSYQTGPDVSTLPVADVATLAAAPPSPEDPLFSPTVLFNGMINPLLHFKVKGVIWYQGESNAQDHRAAQYRTLFPALIADWRRHWGYEFPFLFVQLAGFGHNKSEPAEYQWADLREAQALALAIPHTGMATAVDIGNELDIHPKDKLDVSRRLALVAAKVAYGEDIIDSGPTYQSMEVQGTEIRIKFSSLGGGLTVKDKYGYIRGFEIAGSDHLFHWAQARPDGNDIVVFNEVVREPTAVRYDWANTPDGNLYNREGLPALPFRTDAPWTQ